MVGGWSIRNAVGSVRGALGSVRPSEWATAGTLTVEVLVRGVPDLLLAAADLSPLAASVLINTTVGDPAALVVLNTLFLGTVFYTFLPDVLPARVAVVTDRPLRLTLAAGSAAVAFPAVGVFNAPDAAPWGRLAFPVIVVAVLATVSGTLGHFHLTRERSLLAWESDLRRFVRDRHVVDRDEYRDKWRSYLDGPAPVRWAAALVTVAGGAAAFGLVVTVFGLAGAALNAVFPVLELLVVVGLVLRATGGADAERTVRGLPIPTSAPDPEAAFYDDLTATFRSVRGTTSAMMVVFVLLIVLSLFAGATPALGPMFSLGTTALRTGLELVAAFPASTADGVAGLEYLLRAGGRLSLAVGLPVAIGYAAWYWYRQMRRLPAVFGDTSPAVVRPPGYSVPAAVPLSLCGLVTEVGSVTRVAVSASGLLVPVALVAVGWSVRETLRREPQPAATDRRALPVAFCLTFYAAAVALVGTEFGLVYLGPVVLVWLYYLEPAQDRGAGPVERMRNVFWYVLAIWVVLLAASTVVPTPPIIRYLPGGVVVLAAVGYLVERYAATGSQP